MRFYSNGYGSSVAGTSFGLGLAAVIISIILTILLAILVVPEKRRNGLPKFFQVVHDICNFKGLLLEKVLKVLYIFSTINVMLTGIFTWFSGGYNFGMTFLTGLLILVLGPILVRLAYEFLMLFVLLVKNVIQINNKLNGKNDNPFVKDIDFDKFKNSNVPEQNYTSPYAQPVQPIQPEQPVVQNNYQPQQNNDSVRFCTTCGTKITGNTDVCPNCGKHLN
ncbi:MAG: zinc ribbon domain-containing protein [Ruminococcus bromii]|nr:zinc ribbon domain-containing protein [Ruminococcus bromii]MDY4978154.1 zinc ribbon domain-containing protein [Ruminococcus bromii]